MTSLVGDVRSVFDESGPVRARCVTARCENRQTDMATTRDYEPASKVVSGRIARPIRRAAAVVAGLLLTALSLTAAPLGHADSPPDRNFGAALSGAEEVPPTDTAARGQITLQLSTDGSALDYRLIVANIENVTQAHLHRAPAGTNGGVVAWLYPSGPPAQLIPGRSDGVLATGTITDADLVGPLAGASLSDLVDAIEAGNIYANVHTSQFPGGEIRGQLD